MYPLNPLTRYTSTSHLGGVGEKSALLYLQTIGGKAEGIAVDSHLHSIANSLGWVKTKRAEQTRRKLEERLPRSFWSTINPLVVGVLGKPQCYFHTFKIFQGSMAMARDKGRFQGFQISAGNVWFGLQTLAMLPRAAESHTGFGQEIATEKSKILAKCLNSSNPSLALQMLSDCGMNVTREPLVIGSSPVDWKVALVMQLPLGISSLGSGLPQLQSLASDNLLDR